MAQSGPVMMRTEQSTHDEENQEFRVFRYGIGVSLRFVVRHVFTWHLDSRHCIDLAALCI